MNPLCSESAIRKAADWRAFKRGNDFVALVAEAVFTDTGWRGVVRDGKRPLRVSVIARSPTDIEARCPCRENQADGAFCAHAVAVGLVLAAEKPTAPAKPKESAKKPKSSPPPPATAWQIQLPPPWPRMLGAGKLTVKITVATQPPDAVDATLTTWLSTAGCPQGGMLHLEGRRLADFLQAIAGHERITCEDAPVEILGEARLRIASVERDGDSVVLQTESSNLQRIGAIIAEVSPNTISLITAALPTALATLSNGKSARIPLHAFLEQIGPLGAALAWPEGGWLSEIHFVAAKPVIEISLSAASRTLEARPLVRYGDAPAILPGSGTVPGLPRLDGQICQVRNFEAESQAIETLAGLGFSRSESDPALWLLRDQARIADFLSESLQPLETRFSIIHGPGLAKLIRETSTISPKLEIVASGEDWLEFDLTFQSIDSNKKINPTEVWRLLKTDGGGKSRRLPRELTEMIEPLFSELDLNQQNGRFCANGASVESLLQISKYLTKQNNKNELKEYQVAIPASVNAVLRPYQHTGIGWVLDRLERFRGALLADDMGLGKTVQTIAVIERLFESEGEKPRLPVLVVATTSLLGNWRAEFTKFAPTRSVRILHGSRRDKEKAKALPGEVWLTSYSTLARDLAWYLRQEFLAVVVDEASLMRNPDTDHAKALFKLNAIHRLALTGTPIENGVRDLWSIFRFIQPGWLGGRREFQERYESLAGQGDPWVLRRLRVKTAPFMLRRTKEEVAPDLPSKILIDEFVDLSRDQQKVYRELLIAGRREVERLADAGSSGAARMQMLTALLRLRQACCDLALLKNDRLKQMDIAKRSAKIERLLELLDSALSSNHKMLIFSQFKTQLHEIRECLEMRNIQSLQLDGESRNRQELVDQFQSTSGPPVFLISLKAGGYGLNLTAADVVIHFDPWWNPAAEAQATDRAHRIGQTRPVTVYRLLARGTVEEKVVSLQKRKRAVAMAIDETGDGEASGWSEQDLAALFEGSI